MISWNFNFTFAQFFRSSSKQKIANEKGRITALPVICSDSKIKFPLPIISKLKGVRWKKDNQDEEVDLGVVKIQRKNFGNFKECYLTGKLFFVISYHLAMLTKVTSSQAFYFRKRFLVDSDQPLHTIYTLYLVYFVLLSVHTKVSSYQSPYASHCKPVNLIKVYFIPNSHYRNIQDRIIFVQWSYSFKILGSYTLTDRRITLLWVERSYIFREMIVYFTCDPDDSNVDHILYYKENIWPWSVFWLVVKYSSNWSCEC